MHSGLIKKMMRNILISFLFALLFITNANNPVLAVPAAPIIHCLWQTDGTEFQVKQWGDEWQHGWETLDGYTILFDKLRKNWVYAKQGISRRLTKSNLTVGRDAPFGISRHLRSVGGVSALRHQRAYIRSTPSAGAVKIPVVLINFSDTETEYSASDFQELLFGNNPFVATGPGSMSDYYSEVSYGNLSLSGEVEGWVIADHEHDYCGQDGGHGQKFGRSGELVKEAVQKVDAYVDFSQYDNDGDGYVDCVIVVHQGLGQEASGDSNDIWSHRYWLRYWDTGVYHTDDGVTVDSYTMQSETQWGQISTIGLFSHEFGHVLGLPDLYDLDYSSDGIGNWGLMSGGLWNKTNLMGDTPAHPMAWSKWYLGWVSPTQVGGLMDDELITQVETDGDVYQFLNNPGGPGDWNSWGGGSGEYFLVENRQRFGFDAGLPGSGLLVWHIDESQPDNTNEAHRLVHLEAADGKNDLDDPYDGNEGDGGDPFPGSSANRTFNDTSNPNSKLYDGSASGISVTEISDSGFTMTADLVAPQVNHPPNTPSVPTGPDTASPGTSYYFTATTTDSDGDQVAFKFDWGDGSESNWTSFVDSGGSAGASHSWANHGTYQVKAKAKDANDAESGWSEAHTIVISRPDLTITSISPDTASVDKEVEIIVTVTNEGAQDVTQDFYVDVYYDPSSPPDKGQYGDERQQITETVQAGESIEVTFTHTFNSSGNHEVWAQVDSSDFVSETDEDNNIYGPHTIAVSERRHENESFSLAAEKWKMISIPFTLDDPSPNAVLVDDLGPQNDAVWKLYRWNTANESYDKYPNVGDFSPGKSFWIISEDTKTVDTGPGTDVSRQTDFVINLPSGWSQIGNPFPFSIDWNEVKVRRNAEVVSILEAQARGWARDKIWYWDGQSYLVYQAPSGTIDPYEGYWVRALLDCELLVSPNESQQAKAFEQTVNSKEEFLQLKAKVGELEDNFNFLGFSESARDGYDRLDIEEAPPISPYISLFFPHPEWEKNKGDYTQDIRTRGSQAGLTWFWDFQVKTDQLKKEIILEWENTSVISEELYLYLMDPLSNALANMREKNSYRFTSSSELESFKIIATYEALPLPEDLVLTEVYSYPNPAHGAGAKFHFHLASWAKVTIKVYTIAGELVRTVVEDTVFLPGAYEELWEEKNDKGEKLARGVYIFIIQAGNPAKVISKCGKIALLE